jgi:hypothetical protein
MTPKMTTRKKTAIKRKKSISCNKVTLFQDYPTMFHRRGSLKNRIRIILSRSFRIRIGIRIRSRPNSSGSTTKVWSRDIFGWRGVKRDALRSWESDPELAKRFPLLPEGPLEGVQVERRCRGLLRALRALTGNELIGCLFVCLSDCSLSVYLTVWLSIWLSDSLSVCLSVFLSISLFVFFFCLFVFWPLYLFVCFSSRLLVCLSVVALSVFLFVCLFVYLSACLLVYLLACLSICMPVCQSACIHAKLFVFMPARNSVCLCVCLTICLPLYRSVCLTCVSAGGRSVLPVVGWRPVCLTCGRLEAGLSYLWSAGGRSVLPVVGWRPVWRFLMLLTWLTFGCGCSGLGPYWTLGMASRLQPVLFFHIMKRLRGKGRWHEITTKIVGIEHYRKTIIQNCREWYCYDYAI